jgi:uncharacterized Fe-S cluster-containing radical SAM superfamily protein
MKKTREQLDEALDRLEDSVTDLVRTRRETELAADLKEAARRIENRLAERDRRHYEARFRLILWNAGIMSEGH